MSNTTVTPDFTELLEDQTEKCVTCPHPTAEHDPISARFCGATVAGGFTRGCVCTPSLNQG
jgi:hypothetical protein